MPKLVRLFIVNGAIGVGLGGVFTGMLLWLNIANLGDLVARSPDGWLAVVMLVWFSGITFGGVQIAIRVMSMAEPEGGNGGTRRPEPACPSEPIRVAVTASRRN